MDTDTILTFLLQGNQLKRTARTGWVQRGVPHAENVAAHSFGVVFVALTLAELAVEPLDRYKVLAMATLHDLAEALTTDIPPSAWRYLPPGIKMDAERQAMQTMLGQALFADSFMALWEELHLKTTPEARLVDDADKLEMFIQAVMYEEQTGNGQLAEFWSRPHSFFYPQSQALYDALCQRRNNRS